MPSALSNQNNYYATHHRRQSSLSQNNLPDLIRTSSSQLQSPSQSLVFLPSTAYGQQQTTGQRARTPSLSTASRSQVRLDLTRDEDPSHDPHDFYRQYQDPFSNTSPVALHQEGIRATSTKQEEERVQDTRKASIASAHSGDDYGVRSTRNSVSARKLSINTQNGAYENPQPKTSGAVPNTLRSRKASFKDLVARFDASPEEVPPMPTQQFSRPASRTASPKPYATNDLIHHDAGSTQSRRPSSRLSDTYRKTGDASASVSVSAKPKLTGRNRGSSSVSNFGKSVNKSEASQPGRKLLFGEVLPSTTEAPSAAGYGISNPRRRRGSEGSPMHSPNPMFPPSHLPSSSKKIMATQQPRTLPRPLSPIDAHPAQASEQPRPSHRRANSDFVHSTAKLHHGPGDLSPVDIEFMARSLDYFAQEDPKVQSQSRIPVISRHHRISSDSAAISPSSRSSHISQLPLRVVGTSPSSLLLSPAPRKTSSPKRRPKSPIQITSPGRRGKESVQHGSKSPSLRANIIAPPPKISPPLRSSRPRMPVSAATTAASRAKMAEKFQVSAREQSDRKAYRRQRPPELSDIDLKARRLRITQALSRSREGEDLNGMPEFDPRASSMSRTTSMTPSVDDAEATRHDAHDFVEVPAVVVEPASELSDEHAFYATEAQTTQDQRAFTQNAFKIVDEHPPSDTNDIDSPTLGHPENNFGSIPLSLNTQLVPLRNDEEPQSALTVATEATIIDAEPQADATRLQTPSQSLLSQINILRSRGSYSPMSATSEMSGDGSDHADDVSVQLMFRRTTYMDGDEAAEKGFLPYPQTLSSDKDPSPMNERSSWTSSLEDHYESEKEAFDTSGTGVMQDQPQLIINDGSVSNASSDHSSIEDDSSEVTPRDTYTIVNIVLQKQTPSGVVDQQLVDDIYHRIVRASPDLAEADNVDEERVQQLCLQELEDYHETWDQQESPRAESVHIGHVGTPPESRDDKTNDYDMVEQRSSSPTEDQVDPASSVPPTSYRGHRYKPSLDSAEDWAETSPSVVDWMQFALQTPPESDRKRETLGDGIGASEREEGFARLDSADYNHLLNREQVQLYADSPTLREDPSIPPPPSHSPPAPPETTAVTNEHSSWSAPVGIRPPTIQTPKKSRPLTAASQMSAKSSLDQHITPSSSSMTRPSEESEITPEQRRLKQRRHVLKEIVDTEYTYERDMRVLCDIYKQTAIVAISDEDIKLIFGNVDLVQQFAKDFLGILKQVSAPAYIMEKSERKKDGKRVSAAPSTILPDEFSSLTDAEKDEQTQVGRAFEAAVGEMEKVYTDYIRTRHAANKRMETLQSSTAVREWLKECSDNSSDITNAWSLDALLVKPIQRITKYPLLLHQLLEATPSEHPDIEFVRKAFADMTEINVRINDVKKHTEIVDQVLNRKRKESDVRNGLTKAFGRRAEKLRQHVGMNEMFEDEEFTKIKRNYDNNIAHLFLVTKDLKDAIEVINNWVTQMCGLAAVAEAWVDVGHTNHPQAESKLRQLAIVVRGIHSIALPDHVEQMTRRVIQPMEKTAAMLVKFKSDPKGLIQKREKRLIDYNQFKNKKDRGEKLDKKMVERMEQWEALNIEAKARMVRLQEATGSLVRGCQITVMNLHQEWLKMCNQKFSAAMGIDLGRIEFEEIIRDWQEEYDPQHAFATTLSICNGTLLADAVNLLSFLTPGTTLQGDDSPRQPSWNSSMKRSVSTNDESTHALLSDKYHRHSEGPHSFHSDERGEQHGFSFSNGRIRAPSSASGKLPKTPDSIHRIMAPSTHTTNSANVSRPSTSPRPSEDTALSPPRVSLEAPSPTIGALLTESPVAAKHSSVSTFYSASADQSHTSAQVPPSRGSIFSSAMPMGDVTDTETMPPNEDENSTKEPGVLFTAASVYEFNIDRSRQQGGFRYLTYVTGEIFDVIAEHGELWLAINQDDSTREIGWIWNKHFAKLAA